MTDKPFHLFDSVAFCWGNLGEVTLGPPQKQTNECNIISVVYHVGVWWFFGGLTWTLLNLSHTVGIADVGQLKTKTKALTLWRCYSFLAMQLLQHSTLWSIVSEYMCLWLLDSVFCIGSSPNGFTSMGSFLEGKSKWHPQQLHKWVDPSLKSNLIMSIALNAVYCVQANRSATNLKYTAMHTYKYNIHILCINIYILMRIAAIHIIAHI